MTEKKPWTPGPWYSAKTGNHQGLVISENGGGNVAVAYNGQEDAVLMAAAPELADALAEFCKTFMVGSEGPNEWPDLTVSYNVARAILHRIGYPGF